MRHSVSLFCLLMACAGMMALPADAQPGPGPGGGGPGEPPRTTPGLDPVTLSGMAAAGYFGYQAFKNRFRK